MRSFHDDAGIKDRYLKRIERHLAAGDLGLFADWEARHISAVSCTVHECDYDRYPAWLGLPAWLAVAEDLLFYQMPQDRASTWPRDFLAAIPVGIEDDRLDRKVMAPFIVILLDAARASLDRSRHQELDRVIVRAIDLWQRDDLYEHRWFVDLVEAGNLAWRLATGPAGSPEWRAGMLATGVVCVDGSDSAEWISDGLEHADPCRFDYFADELLKLLDDLAPRRTGDAMLAAVRAA